MKRDLVPTEYSDLDSDDVDSEAGLSEDSQDFDSDSGSEIEGDSGSENGSDIELDSSIHASESTLEDTFDDDAHYQSRIKIWRRQPRPLIEANYDSDTSDEETTNTIGNVPLEWYNDLDHIGYDIHGKKILKPEGLTRDAIDEFLSNVDNKEAWRKVVNKLEGKEVTLGPEELELLGRIQKNQYPDASFDPYPEALDIAPFHVMPLSGAPEPKRRFIPSKLEASKIMKIARAIKKGLIVPGKKTHIKERTKVYDLWGQESDVKVNKNHIPAPKVALPHHMESYNPPAEYLLTPEELKEYESLDPEDRPHNFVPQKYDSLRKVPGYDRFIQEQFSRCLDLYLCPRMIKQKLDIDPESLIPKLPQPQDLHPFPHRLAVTYEGHKGRVRTFSIDPTGQFIASGSDDKTVRIWELATGRCLSSIEFEDTVMAVQWNPMNHVALLAVCAGSHVILMTPNMTSKPNRQGTQNFVAKAFKESVDPKTSCVWTGPTSVDVEKDIVGRIQLGQPATQITWHKKGDYFATVSPSTGSDSVHIHQLSKVQSQSPFSKSKGQVQRVLFHPSKPILFVATQRYVKMYNLVKQELFKTLLPGCKWISSLDIHRSGDHLIVGSYDSRIYWFDMDLSLKPYKMLRYHKSAVRQVTYHSRYPLFASASDDGSSLVFHGTVYNDLLQNPLIVPLKSIKAHSVVDHLGALHCQFHPVQPWLVTAGADGFLKLFTSS